MRPITPCSPFSIRERVKRLAAARNLPVFGLGLGLLGSCSVLSAYAQTVTFNAPFSSISQRQVTYGQGIVADAESNLYISGTVNLLYLQRNANGSYTPASSKIDSVGGTAYGLAIDASNNLYRPDIAPNSYPALAKYVYQGVNSFQKFSIGTWTTANKLSSVAVDSNYNVYVLDAGGSGATSGSIIKLTPSISCSSLSTCTSYTQTLLVNDARLYSATGLSFDGNGNFYFTSGPTTGGADDCFQQHGGCLQADPERQFLYLLHARQHMEQPRCHSGRLVRKYLGSGLRSTEDL